MNRIQALLRHVPRIDDVPRMVTSVAARRLLRRPPMRGDDFVSKEAPLIIIGMHRSGTSIVTRLLERGGLYVGGSWLDENHESIYFSRANRAMCGEGPYLVHDYGWTAPKSDDFIAARRGYAERAARKAAAFFADRANERAWGWKDPRNALTLPVWLSIYPDAKVLHLVRDGRAVALSLAERDSLDVSFGLALWAHYAARAEHAMGPLPEARRLTVRFEDLMAQPVAELGKLYAFVGLSPQVPLDEIARDIDPERATAPLADPRVAGLADHPMLARYSYR
jgi:hypothetical protein